MREGFADCPSELICPVFFSWFDWDGGFGEDHTGHFHQTVFRRKGMPLSWLYTVGTDLGHLAQVVLSGFSSAELPLPPPQYHPLWQDITTLSPRIKSGELWSTSLKVESLHKSFGFLLKGRIVSLPLFVYLFNQLCKSGVGSDIYFILWVTVHHSSFAHPDCFPWSIRSSFTWPLSHFDSAPSCGWDFCCCFVLRMSFLLATTGGFRHILCASYPSPQISHFSKDS